MGRAAAVRFMGLYVPVIAAFLLVFLRPSRKRIFPAALLGFVWTLPSLLAVQLLNLHFGWWRFNALGGLFRGMPVDLYLGWAVLWGILPILSFDQTGIVWVSAAFFGIDLILTRLLPCCRSQRSMADWRICCAGSCPGSRAVVRALDYPRYARESARGTSRFGSGRSFPLLDP
jgi:hypothetical protein